MDIYLNKDMINYVKNVFSTSLSHEATMEMIVPDALPDILRIVDTDATVFLRSKSTDNGRVSVSGAAAVTVLYCAENEEGVRKLELEIPFSTSATDGELTQNSRVTANVAAASADTSVVNPRKIVARVDLITHIDCYNDAELLISSGIDEDSDAEIVLLTDNLDVNTTTDVREKTFVISEELPIPASNPPVGEILKYKVGVTPEETKVVGSKLILRGTTNITLLYHSTAGEMTKADFANEFSQIMELDNAVGESAFNVNLMLTSAYLDSEQSAQNPDGRTLLAEIHVVAQCVVSESRSLSYIADMFSTKYQLEQTTQAHELDSRANQTANAVFHGILEAPTPVARVVAINAHAGLVTQEEQTLRCPLSVGVLYVDDEGRVMSALGRFEAEAGAQLDPNAGCTASAVCGRDAYGVVSGGGIELRIPVDFFVTEKTASNIHTLTDLSFDETAPLNLSNAPSIVIYRTGVSDTLWNLAKKNCSTPNLIINANDLDREEDVAPGQLLIIPRKR